MSKILSNSVIIIKVIIKLLLKLLHKQETIHLSMRRSGFGDVPHVPLWVFVDVPMRLNFGVLRSKSAPYRKQKGRKRSV